MLQNKRPLETVKKVEYYLEFCRKMCLYFEDKYYRTRIEQWLTLIDLLMLLKININHLFKVKHS